jgi:hypothetical protein
MPIIKKLEMYCDYGENFQNMLPKIINIIYIRPCRIENTGSRPITEVKQCRAWLVLGWVTVL